MVEIKPPARDTYAKTQPPGSPGQGRVALRGCVQIAGEGRRVRRAFQKPGGGLVIASRRAQQHALGVQPLGPCRPGRPRRARSGGRSRWRPWIRPDPPGSPMPFRETRDGARNIGRGWVYTKPDTELQNAGPGVPGPYGKCEGDHHESAESVWLHPRLQSRLDRRRVLHQLGLVGHPSPAKAGDGHSTDGRWQAVPGIGGRTGQQQRHQRRVHEAGVAHTRRSQIQHHPGGRFLGPDRAAGRQVRFQRAGWHHPGRAE